MRLHEALIDITEKYKSEQDLRKKAEKDLDGQAASAEKLKKLSDEQSRKISELLKEINKLKNELNRQKALLDNAK